MTTSASATRNPFADPPASMDGAGNTGHLSLSVGRDASLTLATDTLVVLGELRTDQKAWQSANGSDEAFAQKTATKCCGLWPSGMPFPSQ